jgi:hypothetical protein
MCNPILIGMAVGAAASASKAKQAVNFATYEKGIADYRARVLENEAESVKRVGLEKELDVRERAAQVVSMQRAQLGASGVDLGSGSALALQQDTETLSEVDALRVRRQTGEQSLALTDQAAFESQVGSDKLKSAKSKAFGTVLTGTILGGIGGAAAAGAAGTNAAGVALAPKWYNTASSALSLSSAL